MFAANLRAENFFQKVIKLLMTPLLLTQQKAKTADEELTDRNLIQIWTHLSKYWEEMIRACGDITKQKGKQQTAPFCKD